MDRWSDGMVHLAFVQSTAYKYSSAKWPACVHCPEDSSYIHCNKKLICCRDSARRRSLSRSRSRSLILVPIESHINFLLVNSTNLHPVLHQFQVIAYYWSNFRFRQRDGYLTLTRSFGVKHWTREYDIWPQETRNITLSCDVKYISISWTV